MVVLTGVTGTLGVWIFDMLCSYCQVEEIHCLIRAPDVAAAEQRLIQSLAQRRLASLQNTKAMVYCHPCNLSDRETLGLAAPTHRHLREKATVIIHAAWAVNFTLPLEYYEEHRAGLSNLIDLAIGSKNANPPCLLFCSSTASVTGEKGPSNIEEKISYNAEQSSKIGYGMSKWVAESMCDSAHRNTRLKGRIGVIRIGQLCGDTENGVWNKGEAWPLMFASSKVTGVLPDLDEKLHWLRVDIAARAIVQIAFSLMKANEQTTDSDEMIPCPVFHVLNGHERPSWSEMLEWIKAIEPGLEVIPPTEWIKKLEAVEGVSPTHPARRLLPMWKEAYGEEKVADGSKPVGFGMERTLQAAPILGEVEPIDEGFFRKLWSWVQAQSYE